MHRPASPFPFALALVVALAACTGAVSPSPASPAAAPPPTPADAQPDSDGKVSRFAEDPRLGVYVSSRWGFSTSSYWIEGSSGLIAIDTQFLPSAAEEFIRAAEAMTGKKVELAVVLHANPDKFNGTATFQRRGIRVVTSEQVLRLIPTVHEKRLKAFYERYEPDYPKDMPQPESFGRTTTELSAGGLKVKAHVLGPGCSEAHVVVEFSGHVFAGDLVANRAHSWLEIGRTDEWLLRIDEMRAMKARFVHPGRGPSGDAGLLDQEEKYLRKVIELVAAEKPRGDPSQEAIQRIKTRLLEVYPDLEYPVFLRLGLRAEWHRQARLAEGAKR
jgi:glyoxylase-like metal-dependent hydrolase (beta-lactamase superfamily II)